MAIAKSGFHLDTREFDATMARLASESLRTEEEIITMNARALVRSLAWETPYRMGALKGGWAPAWQSLGMGQRPNKAKPMGLVMDKRGFEYAIVEGRFEDHRAGPGVRSFAAINTTWAPRRGKGGKERRRYYGYILNARNGWMQRAVDKVTVKMDELYIKLLRKHSAKVFG